MHKNSSQFLFERYSAQLGEMVWHSYAVDEAIPKISREHFESICACIKQLPHLRERKPIRFLEIGAYAHFTGQLLGNEMDIDVTLTDISPKTLLYGQLLAEGDGIKATPTLVACDFHRLPFQDYWFDFVYIASSVHHSRTPEVVLAEAVRVLSHDGILYLQNEPCTRLFSFYQFLSNREDQFTAFERRLADKGLLRTLSSPFYGARSESLFGMVENDKIPLSLYLKEVGGECDIVELGHDYKACMGPFDHEIMARRDLDGKQLEQYIRTFMMEEFGSCEALLGDREKCLGFSLPTEKAIDDMSKRVAQAVGHLSAAETPQACERGIANIFGAVLRLVARRKTGPRAGTGERFSRLLKLRNDVWLDSKFEEDTGIRFDETLSPEIQSDNKETLSHWFVPGDWEHFRERNGVVSMLNVKNVSRVHVPIGRKRILLLVRFYAVEHQSGPYRLRISCGKTCVDEHVICQSESRLGRLYIEYVDDDIAFELSRMDGTPMAEYGYLRISILRIVAVSGGE